MQLSSDFSHFCRVDLFLKSLTTFGAFSRHSNDVCNDLNFWPKTTLEKETHYPFLAFDARVKKANVEKELWL